MKSKTVRLKYRDPVRLKEKTSDESLNREEAFQVCAALSDD